MEHEAAFERLTRKLDDYHELLIFGRVMRRVADPDAWRREIRAQARRDKVRVRTLGFEDGGVVALRLRGVTDEGMRQAMVQYEAHGEAMDRATLLGHRIDGWLRSGDGQGAARCSRCRARLYVDSRVVPPIFDGEVFEVECR